VHPPHVPLEGEPESAHGSGSGDAGPGGRLLRDGHAPGLLDLDGFVELTQEGDRFEILPAAVRVGRPLAGLAAVVEIQHGRDRVDAEPIDVELVQPVERVGDQEIADLVAPVVEHERAPVGVLTAARVFVLVEGGAIEPPQGEVVLRKVRGNPVQDHAESLLVAVIHKEAEIVG
jgi:hypothetical protein